MPEFEPGCACPNAVGWLARGCPARTRPPCSNELAGFGRRYVVEHLDRFGVDFDEFQADIEGQRIDLRRLGHAPDCDHRLIADTEGHAENRAQLDLAAHGFETDSPRRQVAADAQQIPGVDRCEGDHLIRSNSSILASFFAGRVTHLTTDLTGIVELHALFRPLPPGP